MSYLKNSKETFLSQAAKTLTRIVGHIDTLPIMNIESEDKALNKENTAIVIIDMINGFVREGALQSPRAEEIIPYLKSVLDNFDGYKKLFVTDAHPEDAVEFNNYPPHAIENSSESRVVNELLGFIENHAEVIKKNSTNAFVSKDFTMFLENNPKINHFIVVGVCTDICVMQFVLSLKTYFNEHNEASRIIVPIKGVETFDLDITNHNADLMNIFALYTMESNGIELVQDIVRG